MSRSMRRPLILAVSAAALGLALSGCISPNTSHESGARNSSPEPEASATPRPYTFPRFPKASVI